jgi:hypothetical protein
LVSLGHLLCLGFDGQHVASGVVAFLAAWVLASGLPPLFEASFMVAVAVFGLRWLLVRGDTPDGDPRSPDRFAWLPQEREEAMARMGLAWNPRMGIPTPRSAAAAWPSTSIAAPDRQGLLGSGTFASASVVGYVHSCDCSIQPIWDGPSIDPTQRSNPAGGKFRDDR